MIKKLDHILPPNSMKYYISQDEIIKFHPLNKGKSAILEASMALVAERYPDKHELGYLVNALLHKLYMKDKK